MSALHRRLDMLSYIPLYPKKINTKRLLGLLEMQGHNPIEMRTVQRDLEAIEKLGIFGLIVDKRSKPFGWSIDANWQHLNISLMDLNTALAFSTLEHLADNLLPESTQKQLSGYFEKANQLLAEEESSLISHWKNSVAMISHATPFSLPEVETKVLNQLKGALFQQKQISAKFKRYLIANQEPVWKHYNQISPLGLIYQEGRPILLCSFGTMHTKIYRFPVAFIKDVQLQEQAICKPKHFNFTGVVEDIEKAKTKGKQISLVLKIRRDTPFIIKGGKLGFDQSLVELDDTDYYQLTATVAETEQLRAFLRGLGSNVEIIEPPSLRQYFIKQITNMYEKYTQL